MNEEVTFILPSLEDIVQLSESCCCRIEIEGHGWAGGSKLVIQN